MSFVFISPFCIEEIKFLHSEFFVVQYCRKTSFLEMKGLLSTDQKVNCKESQAKLKSIPK